MHIASASHQLRASTILDHLLACDRTRVRIRKIGGLITRRSSARFHGPQPGSAGQSAFCEASNDGPRQHTNVKAAAPSDRPFFHASSNSAGAATQS